MIDSNFTSNFNKYYVANTESYGNVNDYYNYNASVVSSTPTFDWANACVDEYNATSNFNRFEFWTCGVLLNLVGVLGILGNILSMVILSRPQMRSSINYLLIGLARCDTVLIVTSMLLFGIPAIYPYTGWMAHYYFYVYPNISPVVFPIATITQTASVYMTFTVTLERYVAVCHPLRARALCTYGRAKVYFVVCIVFSVLYNLPRFWEVVVVAYSPDGENVVYCVRPSKMRQDREYINIYIHWCYLFVIYIIPFLNLAILNCLIYRQVKKANRERQRLSRSEQREIGLATMLLCVVVVFFIFNFLALYTNIEEAFYDDGVDDFVTKLSNLLVTINSSANFIIYVIFGEKFKRIFLQLFFKRRLSRDTPDLIHYESSISNGDGGHRSSGRFSRHGTQRSTVINIRNGTSLNNVRTTVAPASAAANNASKKIVRTRAPSPGPCVYYPARDVQRAVTTCTGGMTTSTSISCDWDNKNGLMTSGF